MNPAAFDPQKFETGHSDPRLAECLKEFPPAMFSEPLYQSIELMERYSIELAADLLGRLNVVEQLGKWRSVDELCALLCFRPSFRLPLQWILARLIETGCIEVQRHGAAWAFRLCKPMWQVDLKRLRAIGLDVDPANAATLDLLDHAAGLYPAVASGRRSDDQNFFGPQNIALWLNYFDNDNLTYAVNNWIAADAAAERLRSRSPLRILELGAGTGSATDALLKALDKRDLLPRVERYLVTEPNPYFRRRNQRKLTAQYPTIHLQWEALDLNLLWSTQGIVPGEFDLVFAVNVMHIARDLLFSLNEAHSTLAIDGWLVLGECLRPYENQPIYPELMFQILDSFSDVKTDSEIRPNPGFLTSEQWRRAFSRCGFGHIEVAPDTERIREIYPHFFTGAVCGQNTSRRDDKFE